MRMGSWSKPLTSLLFMLTVLSTIDSILDFTFLFSNKSYSSGDSCFKIVFEAMNVDAFDGESLRMNENFFWKLDFRVSTALGDEAWVYENFFENLFFIASIATFVGFGGDSSISFLGVLYVGGLLY
jgi:glycogen debranching enzyme